MRTSSRPMRRWRWCSGANLGSAINPVFEGARRDNPASYRLPLGNLFNRLVGVLLVHAVPAAARRPAAGAGSPTSRSSTAEFHIAFNVATAIVFIGLLDAMARLLNRLLPDRVQEADPVAAALSRRDRAGDTVAGARRCRARNVAHGRCRRDHAAQGDDGDDDRRPRAGRSGVARPTTWSTGSTRRSSSTSPS